MARRVVCPAVVLAWAGIGIAAGPPAPPPPLHFVTTPMLEADRCATAWVVRRFVDPRAVFTFHEAGHMPAGAEPYDLPEATLRRDARRATVEVLIEQRALTDPFVLHLGRLVHDIEVNAWATRREPGSVELEGVLGDAFVAAGTPEKGLEACFTLLDRLRAAGGDVSVLLD